ASLGVQVRWNLDCHGGEQVTLRAVLAGRTFTADAEGPPIARAGRQFQGLRATERQRHLHLATECDVIEVHRDGHRDVVVLAGERRVGRNVHRDVEVTVVTSALTGSALAAQPYALAVLDARRDARTHRRGGCRASRSVA